MTRQDEPVNMIVLGLGAVGRALIRQAAAVQQCHPWVRLCGLGDTSGLWLAPYGLTCEAGLDALAWKESGQPLARWPNSPTGLTLLNHSNVDSLALADALAQIGVRRATVLDLTASPDLFPLHLALRAAGHHLVLANKWPLVSPYADYVRFWQSGNGANCLLHETTVGAALPVIRTLDDRRRAGDRVREIVACVSGTLGFLASSVMDGVPFSTAVRTAAARGYTEPDPRVDLSGIDAQRKALILARKLGARLDMADVRAEGLLPEDFYHLTLEQFWAALPSQDRRFADLAAAAREWGQVLRFVARVTPDRPPVVSLEAVPGGSVLASIGGAENLFQFRTDLYHEQPLIVRGPGAGAELTASGVLADVVSIRR